MIEALEQALGYTFRDKSLLRNALTHSSYANEIYHESLLSNERLEFLGDSILGMVVAEFLYRSFPDWPEGELTRMRADMVCENTLAEIAHQLDLGRHLLLGHGEEQGGGRSRNSILADAVESVLAASFLDGGFPAARGIIERLVLTHVPKTQLHNRDYKTALQERVQQKRNQMLTYTLIGESGPDHDKRFTMELLLNSNVFAEGIGKSKKEAEQMAAKKALENMGC